MTAALAPPPRWPADLKQRARNVLAQEIDFIPNAEFAAEGAQHRILRSPPASRCQEPACGVKKKPPRDLPAHLAALCEAELLTADQERDFFRRMNFLKYRANSLRVMFNSGRGNRADLEEIDALLREADEIRNSIVRANMRLVISVAKKFVTPQYSFDEMLSDGIMTLMHVVEKFDYDRGFRFSTYAYRSLARAACRTIAARRKEQGWLRSGVEDADAFAIEEGRSSMDEQTWAGLRTALAQLMEQLDGRERLIIAARYSLNSNHSVRTFQSLADELGVSKERVRQLEQRALAKLRKAAAHLAPDALPEPAAT